MKLLVSLASFLLLIGFTAIVTWSLYQGGAIPTNAPMVLQAADGTNAPVVLQAADGTNAGAITTTITSIASVPVYPGANRYDSFCHDDPYPHDKCTYSFRTIDSGERVATFYKATFAQNGWLLDEVQGSPRSTELHFVWISSAGILPPRLFVGVIISPSSFEEGKTYIGVRFERWPISQKIPLYKDAYDTQMHQEKIEVSLHTVTTYMTKADPDTIKDFYEDILTNQGWEVKVSRKVPRKPEITFIYIRYDPMRITHSEGEISVTPKTTGETEVELRIITP
jgi:hypothetical protein